MNTADMDEVARQLVAPGKGILAADESGPTIEKRFRAVGVASVEDTRRAYREMLFASPGLGNFISGVILYDETLRQSDSAGVPFPEILVRQGMIPGIKVDKGAKPLPRFPGETITEGLDGLRDRLTAYFQMGARFAKWRAVIAIGAGLPTFQTLRANAHALGRFAALSQEAGLVPVVEPEVLMDGDHAIERHREVTETVVMALYDELFSQRVRLQATLLKVNMVLSGTTHPYQASVGEVAEATLECMLRTVPPAVPGIVFLSGGQGDLQATAHLDALNRVGRPPWQLSFSFGRALQAPALKAWAGRPEKASVAQDALLHRARCNALARLGHYTPKCEDGDV